MSLFLGHKILFHNHYFFSADKKNLYKVEANYEKLCMFAFLFFL